MRTAGFLFILFGAFGLSSCVSAPDIVPGKGAIYGIVSADSHKALVEKAAREIDTEYSIGGKIVYDKHMVDYENLNEIYVCIIDPNFNGGNEHVLVANDKKMSLMSLALAKGDKLKIKNASTGTLTFYLADNKDGIQVLPPLQPGREGTLNVELVGDLLLGSDEKDHLITFILSRPGLIGRRENSGNQFAFERLNPGTYGLIYWFWRLGFIEKQVVVEAGKNVRSDQVLSVDRILVSRHES